VANLRDIKRRITSVQSTQKITSAMKMVAAAKLRRATDAIHAARPYAQRMQSTLEEVSAGQTDVQHPLFDQREEKDQKTLELVVITSDRGLAGAFNSSVIKQAEAVVRARADEFASVGLTIVGKKAADYYNRRRAGQISSSRPVGPQVNYLESQQIAQQLIQRFEDGDVDEVVLVYSEFVSTMTQKPTVLPLLPFSPHDEDAATAGGAEDEANLPYEVEPSPEKLLKVLVPKAVEVAVFRALLESQAGEHAARMTAMGNATKNTEELIESLTLEYNRARQAAITRELVEIVTGAQALE
jgi:F-type H+-transporting ATPase subunit gamma